MPEEWEIAQREIPPIMSELGGFRPKALQAFPDLPLSAHALGLQLDAVNIPQGSHNQSPGNRRAGSPSHGESRPFGFMGLGS